MKSKPQHSDVTLNRKNPREAFLRRQLHLAAELGRRRVSRTAVSYSLVMWINLQIGDVLFPLLGLPDAALNLILVIGIMGFPMVLVLAWAFQITPSGIIREPFAPALATAGRSESLINVLLLLAAIMLSALTLLQIFQAKAPPVTSQPPGQHALTITTLQFESVHNTSESQSLATAVHGELRHRLIKLEGVEVLPDNSKLNLADGGRYHSLNGTVLLDGNTAHVLAYLIDLSAGRYVMSVAFEQQVESLSTTEAKVAAQIVKALENSLLALADSESARPA